MGAKSVLWGPVGELGRERTRSHTRKVMVTGLRENKPNPTVKSLWFAAEGRSKRAMLGLCLEDGVNEGNLLKVQFCLVALGPALASILLQVRQH